MREGWRTVELGSLCAFFGGGAFPRIHQGRRAGTYPFVKVSDLSLPGNERFLLYANNWVGEETLSLLKTKLVPSRATVFAKIGEGLKSEKLRLTSRLTAIDNNLMAAIPKAENVDNQYLFYLLSTVGLSDWAQGSALPFLRQGDLAQIPVTIPPIAVQRRIAGVLGALDDLIDTNKRLISQLDDVAAAIFNRSITIPEFGRSGPGPGPSLSALRELCSIRSGYAFKSSSWLSDGTPVLQIRNVGDGFIDARSVKYVSSSTTAGARNFVARTGDILIAMTGYVGSVARVGLAEDGYLINQRVGRIESIATSRISSEVLYRSLRMPDTKDAMINVANGSAQANLSAHDFGTITIAVPDLETQARVTHVLKVLDSALDELRLEQFSLVRTRDELLPVLLSGQLSVSEAR